MTALHQLRIDYVPTEDRLLLRLNTHDKTEVRLWLTRRFTRGLWEGLVKVIEANPSARQAAAPEAKKAVIAFQHESAVKDEQFGQAYEENATEFPLGETPQLVTGLKIGPPKKGDPPLISFETAQKKSISIGLDDQILHSILRLLQQVMPSTEWGLKVEFAGAPADGAKKPEKPAQVH